MWLGWFYRIFNSCYLLFAYSHKFQENRTHFWQLPDLNKILKWLLITPFEFLQKLSNMCPSDNRNLQQTSCSSNTGLFDFAGFCRIVWFWGILQDCFILADFSFMFLYVTPPQQRVKSMIFLQDPSTNAPFKFIINKHHLLCRILRRNFWHLLLLLTLINHQQISSLFL